MSRDIPNLREPKGLVQIDGTVDLDQFYYRGGLSDADTVKIEITVESVKFRPEKDAKWFEDLQVFHEGFVNGKPVVENDKIVVRLQGVDAPELHYSGRRDIPESKMTPQQKKKWKNAEFRQWWGARSTWELTTHLNRYEKIRGSGVVEAYGFSRVDSPSDVFDVYGRFVGDIVIRDAERADRNINQWLVKEGWALPTFYDSMTGEEISILANKGKGAMRGSKGVWQNYSALLVPFDFNLALPKKGEPLIDLFSDGGNLNPPKIFRRQVQFEVNRNAGITTEPTLKSYLKNSKKKDAYYQTSEFMKKGPKAKKWTLDDSLNDQGKINVHPWDLVFTEKPSQLEDWNGYKIDSWY